MTPGVGDWIRLVAPRGVTSPAMRAQIGEVGTVLEVRERSGELLVQARFGAVGDVFWLKVGEWELVATVPVDQVDDAPAAAALPARLDPPAREREERTVAHFATAIQKRIDQLLEERADLEAQVQELRTRQATLDKERKALEAAVAAYNRVRGAGAGPPALPAPTPERTGQTPGAIALILARLQVWGAVHDGVIAMAEVVPMLVAEGIVTDRKKATDNLSYLVTSRPSLFERVERGVYRLRDEPSA